MPIDEISEKNPDSSIRAFTRAHALLRWLEAHKIYASVELHADGSGELFLHSFSASREIAEKIERFIHSQRWHGDACGHLALTLCEGWLHDNHA